MQRHAAGEPQAVEWRRFGANLWAGAADFGPIGTIERGRRFSAIDVEGQVLGRSRCLEDAQALLVSVAETRNRMQDVAPAA
jgi:hypothetical protein